MVLVCIVEPTHAGIGRIGFIEQIFICIKQEDFCLLGHEFAFIGGPFQLRQASLQVSFKAQ